MPLVDQLMLDTIDDMVTRIENSIIPKGDKTDFDNGDATLGDFGSFEELAAYNSLLRQRFPILGITAALVTSPEKKAIPIKPPDVTLGGNVLDVLNNEEFVDQGYENPVTELTQKYVYYDIKQNDTLASIAVTFYGDYRQWTRIAQANQLAENDLMDGDLIGELIKIPVDQGASLTRANDNFVFESDFDPSSPESIEAFLYGSDIDTRNGIFEADGYGDIRKLSGIDNAIRNLQTRLDTIKGGLNPIQTGFGVSLIGSDTETPWVVSLERVLKDIETQSQADPRVIAASIDRNTVRLEGEAITAEITIKLLGGFETAWRSEVL